ncbi:MAG TPA: DUF1349 domain-containing protein [Lachnospiraceae bacterium]|nr:DUF1349 domain-containing protein [Lachnospiraceae bacterium]
MKFDKQSLFWIHEPKNYLIEEDRIEIITEPDTDYWQRTYYGFRNDNAPTLLVETDEKFFSFVVKTEFHYKNRFDQCGVIIYQDSDNWIKGSIEYENKEYQRLGSVVTNHGYSDWATTDIVTDQNVMYYRLSRRDNDLCIENSWDGNYYKQMRIAHLFQGNDKIQIGVYACSPQKSSFQAVFSEIAFTECKWLAHS